MLQAEEEESYVEGTGLAGYFHVFTKFKFTFILFQATFPFSKPNVLIEKYIFRKDIYLACTEFTLKSIRFHLNIFVKNTKTGVRPYRA